MTATPNRQSVAAADIAGTGLIVALFGGRFQPPATLVRAASIHQIFLPAGFR